MKKNSFVLYGKIVKIDGDHKTFQPYGEKRVLTIKNKDKLKVGDAISFTLYESKNFDLMSVSLVKFARVPVFMRSSENIEGGIKVVLKTRDDDITINREIMFSDPLYDEIKKKGHLIAAIFGKDKIFLEKAVW